MPDSLSSPQPYPSTLWSAVLGAKDRHSPDHRSRLDRLVRLYWKPVYWSLRSRWRKQHADALDLTQTFFAHLLEKDALAAVAPDKGRFRAWLRVVLDNFMRNELEAAKAQKRGGGLKPLSIDGEDDAPPVPDDSLTPDQAFDRAWAIHLFRSAVEDLKSQYHSEGRDAAFAWFERHELDPDPPTCAQMAEAAGRKPHEVENALKAARVAFAKILREKVTETVADPSRVEEELEALAEAMG
jgi:RNA polymerase sigma factor (sigma-70 family)